MLGAVTVLTRPRPLVHRQRRPAIATGIHSQRLRSRAKWCRDAENFLLAFPDVTLELSSTFTTATHGGAEWVMRGTQASDLPELPATGKRMALRGASMFEFADGKIRRVSDYWDRANLLEQLR